MDRRSAIRPALKGETLASSGALTGHDLNSLAREWALCANQELKNELFVIVADAAQERLVHIAHVMASRIVGPDEAGDIVNDVWCKVQTHEKFNPDVGSFHSFFLSLVRNQCIDAVRNRREIPARTTYSKHQPKRPTRTVNTRPPSLTLPT